MDRQRDAMEKAERELELKQQEDKILSEKDEIKKIEDATKKKEQIMTKQKKKFEADKADLDKKHEEELAAAEGSANQKMITGVVASGVLTLIIAYFLFSSAAAAGSL